MVIERTQLLLPLLQNSTLQVFIAATMKSCTTNNDDDDDKRDDHHPHPTILAAPEGAEIRHILA